MKRFRLNGLLQFISGIMLAIIGFIAIFNANFLFEFGTYLVIYSLMLYGLARIFASFNKNVPNRTSNLIFGILVFFVSILSLLNFQVSKGALTIYLYFLFGFAFMFIAASLLINHLRFRRKYQIWQLILLIAFDTILFGFSVVLFFSPLLETKIIAVMIGFNLLTAGLAEISNSFKA